MRTIALLLLFISFSAVSHAQYGYYTASKAGISLREQPGINGKVLDKIPYGEKLVTMTDEAERKTVVLEGMSGSWLKVSYKNKTGYIASTYTLPLPPPKEGVANLKDYFDQVSSAVGQPLVIKNTKPDLAEMGESSLTKQLYKNGMEWHESREYESGSEVYILPEFSIEQAFLLLRLLKQYPNLIAEKDPFPDRGSKTKTAEGSRTIEVEKDKDSMISPAPVRKIKIYAEEGVVTDFELFILNNQAVISWSAGV